MPKKKMNDTDRFFKQLMRKKKSHEWQTESSLRDCQRMDIPEPAYLFEVGDRVDYGAWVFSEVLEVCEGGKYYMLHSCNYRENTRGEKWHEKIHYEAWFRLHHYRTSEEIEKIDSFVEDDDIFFSYQQRDMSSLLSMMSNGYGIDLDPEYQRELVWSGIQKWSLIDSVFKNIDIGKFTIIKRPWGENPNKPLTPKLYEMLDGKQRITALWEFYCSRFKYRGKYFYEMCPRDKSHFKGYRISWAECNPLTDEQKYRYFLKLNTTGVPIADEHMERVKRLWREAKLHII